MSNDQYQTKPEIGGLSKPFGDYKIAFNVDLLSIEGDGVFNCPGCNNPISPDETEDAYTIKDTIMRGNNLEYLVVQCNKCKSHIQLEGFSLLSTYPEKTTPNQ